MDVNVPTLKQEELNSLVKKYYIPLDLHPGLPPSDLCMSKLPGDVIGMYPRIFDFSRDRILFSSFLISVVKYFKLHLSQLVPLGLNKGDWFSFAKCRGITFVYMDDNPTRLKLWKHKLFLIDRRAIPEYMTWRHPKSYVSNEFPTDGFDQADVMRLCVRCAKLRNIAGVVALVPFGPTESVIRCKEKIMLVPREPHQFNNSILKRVDNHTTTFAAVGTPLLEPTSEEIVASHPDRKHSGNVENTDDTNENINPDDDRSKSSFAKYLENHLDKAEEDGSSGPISTVPVQSFNWRTGRGTSIAPQSVVPPIVDDAGQAWERFGEIKDALTDEQYQQEDIQELMSKLLEDVRNISEEISEYINCPSWNRPTIFYDNDDDEYTIIYSKPKAITPDLPTVEPDNSLSMGDEHLSTIPETETDEVIKSSVENLVPIPSEFKGISEDTCDVPVCEDPSTFDALNDHSEILFDPNDDGTLSDDDDFEDIEYVSLEEVNDVDNSTPDRVLKSPSSFPIPSWIRDTEETRSGSTTTHANHSLPEYASFLFEIEPDQGELTNIVIEEVDTFLVPEDSIPPGIESNFDPGGGEIDVSQNAEDDDSFTFVIRIFLPFLTYPVDFPLLLSTGSEDTIFDPGIST
ncbi:hypothetical protein Tco_0909838 [Tanacetum coccineum]|uniref:Uncharacterized protein n=1 Tax=Tanacetum coccineum TaxID=301880 RepID=A0ABQ5CUE7_9ASTR